MLYKVLFNINNKKKQQKNGQKTWSYGTQDKHAKP